MVSSGAGFVKRAHSRLAAPPFFRNHRAMRGRCAIISALLIWHGVSQTWGGGLDHHRALVVADPAGSTPSLGKIRLTYLGTNGYRFETGKHALLIDPYFSRVGLGAFVFRPPIAPNVTEIERGSRFFDKTEVILATHGHVDHLFDVPPIMQKTRAQLFASRTAVDLAIAAGAPSARCAMVAPGDVRQIGPWKIRVLPAAHDRVFPLGIPFPGPRKGTDRPRRASDWVCGQPLAFLVEAGGRRIYIDSGGTPGLLPPNDLGPVDLAILGVALSDARARFPRPSAGCVRVSFCRATRMISFGRSAAASLLVR